MQDDGNIGIGFVEGGSATAHLHAALRSAVSRFPDELDAAEVPDDPAAFRTSYPEVLPRFEAARAGSGRRVEIARAVVAAAAERLVMHPDGAPIVDAVARAAEPFPTETRHFGGSSRLHPRVTLDGTPREGRALVEAVSAMVTRGSASPAVADAVSWLVGEAGSDGIDLSGRRIAMLGAGAELAPTRLWLDGGADVLWIDVADPPTDLIERNDLAGTLRWIPGGADLLTDPDRVRATIEEFAGGERIDLGLYAYAGGQAREWRLTAAMNAIVDGLPAGLVQGAAMLLSPTTCGVLTDAELAAEAGRRARAPRWLRVLDRVHALGRGDGHTTIGTTSTNRGIVSIQGGSYQGAQYVGKLLAAEVWASADPAINVSVNTAGVSLTESLQHPVFEIAFAGAQALDVETFPPATTAALNGLLTLHDRLDPAAAERSLDELFTTRVHGGIYVAPYPIDPALRVAAGIGVLKDPRRIAALIRR
ncbi:MAG: hypothetical protein QNJ12_20590 [Ilumatobacter sp.]|uniref:hypothetical protein n=1 Tax=Ilumatobacter sp. TaxID=1967498 RepID=UPI00262EC6B0|nr:hypothetical protein [Ilumatobacter sp.]MDJ0771198.1 hypothetical protein [Ilumatobacter sp.]